MISILDEKLIKKVAIYLRKSRGDGEDDVLSKHRARLIRKADKEGWHYTIYEEIASGARIQDRPQMQQLLKDIGNFDGVLVISPDRLGRGELEEQGAILNAFKKASTYIITEDRIYDLKDSNDKATLSFFSVVSNVEYDFIVRRLIGGKREGTVQGKWTNGKPPYGYYYDYGERDQTKRVKVNEEQAKVYRTIIEKYLSGENIQQITNYLNRKRITTPGGIHPLEHGKNQGWSVNAVLRLLKDETHLGFVIAGKTKGNGHIGKDPAIRQKEENWLKAPGFHQPLKTEDEHKRIIARLTENRKVPSSVKMRRHLLTGILCCKKCGHGMVFKQKERDKYERALCLYIYKDGSKCPQKSIVLNSEILEGIFTKITHVDYNYLEKINSDSMQLEKNNELLKELQAKIKKLDKALEIIHETHEQGGYSSIQEYILRKKKNEEQKQLLINEIDIVESQNEQIGSESIDDFLKEVNKFKQNWYNSQLPPEEKNRMIQRIVKKIYYDRNDNGQVTFEIEYK